MNKKTRTCFELLQKIIYEAFQANVLYFTAPYEDISQIDHGIRSLMWPDYNAAQSKPLIAKQSPERRLLVVRSNLGFYNLIAYLTPEKEPDFFAIGPFRAEEFSLEYFPQTVKNLRLPESTYTTLKYFYEGLPYVPLSSILNVTKDILSLYFTEFEEISPTYIEFTKEAHTIQLDTDALLDYSMDFAESYQKYLIRFLSVLKKGDYDAAQEELRAFLQETRFTTTQNLIEAKQELNMLNDYCHMALLETSVHPSRVLKLCNTLRLKIGSINSHDALISLPYDICHKYCLLVKNYAYPEYSKTVRAVINYIHLHLEEELTLSFLASYFHKNPTSLSYSFSSEVGMSVTNYIHQARIDEALKYFNTTKMTVSEVALAVGFQDFAYFSRLFRKQVGCSPREYCRKIK